MPHAQLLVYIYYYNIDNIDKRMKWFVILLIEIYEVIADYCRLYII